MIEMTTEKWLDDNCRLVIDPHDGKPSPYLLKHGGGSFIALEPVKLIKPERESELKKLKRLEGYATPPSLQGIGTRI